MSYEYRGVDLNLAVESTTNCASEVDHDVAVLAHGRAVDVRAGEGTLPWRHRRR
jgi:hypothetical protein